MTIVSNKDFEPNNLEELISYVKDNADKVTLANAGVGAASHLCGLLIEKVVGADLNEVPVRRHRAGPDGPRGRPGRLHV